MQVSTVGELMRYFLLTLLLVASCAADTIPGHTYIDFEDSTDGTTVTATILSNATKGRVFEMYMSDDGGSFAAGSPANVKIETEAQFNPYTPASINGTTYNGTGTRGMRVTHGVNGFFVMQFGYTVPEMSIGFHFRWNGPGVNWGPRDTVAFKNLDDGRYQYLQIYDNASGDQIPYFQTHFTSDSGTDDVNFARGTWYWVTMQYAQATEVFRISFYNATNQVLLGTATATMPSGHAGTTALVLGLAVYGDSSNSSQNYDFDNLIVNTNGTFPLGPGNGPETPATAGPSATISGNVTLKGNVTIR